MNIRNITAFSVLLLLPWSSIAAIISYSYELADNSYYSSNAGFGSEDVITTLTGVLQVDINDVNYTATIDYSNVLLGGSSFRPTDTLNTDFDGINSTTLTSGVTGEPDYLSTGNATLSPFPFICVECAYNMTLNLEANPLVLSYHEYNPYDTGHQDFEIHVSALPLPASAWLFGSGLIGLLSFGNRNRRHT